VHLRQPWKLRELWVDAICINQEDNTEKGAQISLIGHVYFHATRVVVWLGLPDECTAPSIALLNSRAATTVREKGCARWGFRSYGRKFQRRNIDEVMYAQRRLALSAEERDKWGTLSTFLSHPWFCRVWTLQKFSDDISSHSLPTRLVSAAALLRRYSPSPHPLQVAQSRSCSSF
jgi:hypothetical protein